MSETQDKSGGPVPLMQPPFPDLSHLTEEERRIIEGVMFRQQKEEEREQEILRKKQDEVRILESAIRMRNEEQRRKGIELDATCQICLKTKFADGIGHVCNYCNVRCCARCGGKVSLRSNKVIWVCIVCRKKQELLIKTGQWVHSGMAAKHREMERGDILSPKTEKKPKLERAHSEGKENVESHFSLGISRRGSLQQIHRTNSQRELRRQFSQERDSTKQDHHADNSRYSDRSRPLNERSPPGEMKRARPADVTSRDNFSRLHGNSSLESRGGRYEGSSDPSYDRRKDRYPSSETMDHRRQAKDYLSDKEAPWKDSQKSRDVFHGADRRTSGKDQQWISQEDDRKVRSDSSIVRRTSQESLRDSSDRSHRDSRMPYFGGDEWRDSPRKRDYDVQSSGDDPRLRIHSVRSGDERRNHLEPGYVSESRGRGHNNRKKMESVVRNDSLSSDQSESVRPPPPKPHKNKRGKKLRQRSVSSSEEDVQTTPECTSCDEEVDAESESISEKEWLASRKQMSLQEDRRPSVMVTSPTSPDRHPSIRGRIQVRLWYDIRSLQLVVTIVKASINPPKSGRMINPYLKMFLLPDRSEKSKRRTKTIANTYEPKWNQTFVYSPLRRSDLQTRTLEITCWDYDRYESNNFVGEVLIDLSTARLNNENEWYRMSSREESLADQLRRSNLFLEAELSGSATSVDRLSPPSSVSVSRLSDSDISELDYDETIPITRRGFPHGDAGSLSSVGSSPTLVGDDSMSAGERRSRRDLWPDDRRRSSTVNPRDMYSYERIERREPISGLDYPPRISNRVRSRSVVPDDVSLTRSRSPTRRVIEASVHRSGSPPEPSGMAIRHPSGTPSPKKRQLPQIPPRRAPRDQMTLNLEERARQMKLRTQRKPDGVSSAIVSDSEVSPRHSLDRQFNIHPHPPPRSSRMPTHHQGGAPNTRGLRGPSTGAVEGVEKDGNVPPALESDESETSSVSKYSVTSAFSSQSEHPRGSRTLQEFTSPTPAYGPVHPTRPTRGSLNRSSSDGAANEKTNNGSLSDTALTGSAEKVSRPGQQGTTGGKITQFGGLSAKRSNSASQLSVAGHKKRMGFRRKKSSTINVHRSEEVAPLECRHLVKQTSSVSSDGEGSLSGDSSVWLPSIRLVPEGEFSNFIEGLGSGQLVGRQVLASPSLGDIQLSLADRKGNLEVEVIRARGLQPKPGRVVPAPYVKVYLVKGRKCIAKRKTATARKTLDPLYQQQLVFNEDYRNCILQVTVWGDYGRMEKKVFMGVAQIMLDELDLSNFVISWYKLFHHSSLVNLPASVPQNSMMSVDSFG
ncbi:regulating synaptic membrane exocytosis protein 2-like isoform X5 [Argiope bruennichi]|uniref:regulating synaptic membrane exocytosis protein 2-like isoform X5 n=1 Tax=Argiope bruennichi TaxID=94029 RepID=UPI002494165D|nr:regulating synaptic membrane exocytosis protein 2-like isoform X5 [Argiope bruennichi]